MQLNCNCCFADDPARLSVGADGERSRQRQRSATDAAYPFRVHIGPSIRFHRTAAFAATPQPLLRRPTFSALPEKVGKKRRWKRIGLYRSATEVPRRRTLRPAHDKLFTKLRYSAACVETMLPSRAVATQGDGKIPCRGSNWPSTHSPMVPQYLYSIVNLCRGRWRAQPSATKKRYGCGPPLAGAHRPVWEASNSPQIFVKTVRTARADVGIGPYKMLCNIVIGRVFRK